MEIVGIGRDTTIAVNKVLCGGGHFDPGSWQGSGDDGPWTTIYSVGPFDGVTKQAGGYVLPQLKPYDMVIALGHVQFTRPMPGDPTDDPDVLPWTWFVNGGNGAPFQPEGPWSEDHNPAAMSVRVNRGMAAGEVPGVAGPVRGIGANITQYDHHKPMPFGGSDLIGTNVTPPKWFNLMATATYTKHTAATPDVVGVRVDVGGSLTIIVVRP